MPDIRSEFASQVREHVRGYAWVKLVEIPSKYPFDHFTVLARWLKLKKIVGPIWCIRVEGVLAIDKALTAMEPCVEKIISIGGPVVKHPSHLKVVTGYPIKKILETYVSASDVRVIFGGMLTGVPVSDKILGLETECMGLTILPELKEREMLGFARPGWDRHSYSSCFLSSVRAEFLERLTTAVRGEGRPCIGCGYCEDVCPAGIMPYQLHKYLYSDLLEEVDQAGLRLCVECGLCSFVCPSKIELREQFIEAKRVIEQEKKEVRQAEEKRLQKEKEMQEKKGCSVC
jgi:Na+-transporting NADH:ubiquinone oxidoreductase subunit A